MNIFFCLISAVLFYLASPNIFYAQGYPILAWVFAVPLLFALEGKTLRERLALGVIFSLVAYALILSWVINVNIFLFAFFTLLFSIQPILFVVLYPASRSWQLAKPLEARGKILDAFLIPALWVVTEAIRAFVIGGYAWTIGHSQAFIPTIIQMADLFGAYGISFLILLVNTCIYFAIKDRKKALRYFVIGIGFLALTLFYGKITIKNSTGQKSLMICTVQPDISRAENMDPGLIDAVIDRHIALSSQCFENNKPDLIAWPETAVTDDVLKDRILRQKIRTFIAEFRVPMLIGSALIVDGKNYNSAVLVGSDNDVKGVYYKQRLLPFSEYFPFEDTLLFLQKPLQLNNYNFNADVKSGPLSFGQSRFGVAICSEEGYPALLRRQVTDGAQFFAVMLNDAWFQSDAAVMMHAQNGPMAAASFKKPVVRSTNSGFSCAIDQYGRVQNGALQNPKLDKEEVFLFDVDRSDQKTFYAKFGNIFVLLCALSVCVIIWKQLTDSDP